MRRLLLLASLFGPCLAAQSGIHWTPSFDDALAAAKAEHKVVLIAFNMAGERANDELVADHYKDPTLARLSTHTINVFCSISTEARVPGVTASQQQEAERRARLEVLKIGPGEDVIAPQHVFLDAGGAVLSSVAYRITKGELEWAWVDAIRKVDPGFEWQLSPAARAPARLGFGAVERGQNEQPPSKADVQAALKDVKKSRGAMLRNLKSVHLLMRSDEPEAIAFVQGTLKGIQGAPVAMSLDTIGLVSPKAYWATVADYLDDRDEDVRDSAARAIEHLAEPKALPATMKAWKLEKSERVRGHLLRALAASAPTNKEVVALIDKVLLQEPGADLRAQAVLALALIEDKAKVQAGLAQALRDKSSKVRATAAFALASRRDVEVADRLGEAASVEEEPDTKAWIEAAEKVVRGGDASAFANFLERVLGETPVKAGTGRFGGGPGGRRG
ncbi:MAG TPA: HEAT repeat domain-containing protein [Planctomycetota bacterium]|nr:HEAT repeat domain-containing protein [Planctomycetota bacterium]